MWTQKRLGSRGVPGQHWRSYALDTAPRLAPLGTGLDYLQPPPARAVGRLTTPPSISSHVQNTPPNYPPWIYGDGLGRRRHFCRRGPALNECDRRGHHLSLPNPMTTGERAMMMICMDRAVEGLHERYIWLHGICTIYFKECLRVCWRACPCCTFLYVRNDSIMVSEQTIIFSV